MIQCFVRKAETSAAAGSGETGMIGTGVDDSVANTSFLRFFLSFFEELMVSAAWSSSPTRFRFLISFSDDSELARRVVVKRFFAKQETKSNSQ